MRTCFARGGIDPSAEAEHHLGEPREIGGGGEETRVAGDAAHEARRLVVDDTS